MEQYYRYEEVLTGHPRVTIYLRVYNVIKHTPCGVWIELPYGMGKRFILNYARKRYALPTKEEALKSFRARKQRQVEIYRAKLEIAELALITEPVDDECLLSLRHQ